MKDKKLLLAVLAQIEREKTVSIPQLAALLDLDEAEVYDALETLVFAYDASSIRLDLHDTYATLDTYGTDRLLRLTGPETDALLDALEKAGFAKDDELVTSLLKTKSVMGADGARGARLQVISEHADSDVSQTVAAACEDIEHHLLRIAYQGIDDDAARERTIEPARMFSEDGHRYVQAYCHEACGWRSFRVDRISSAKPLDQTFTSRKGIPPSTARFGGEPALARIELAPGCPTPSWHGLRAGKPAPDGTHIVTVEWTGSSWLPKHVVALMGDARVLEPACLKDACAEYARALLAGAEQDLP